jgi:hypothetical protein
MIDTIEKQAQWAIANDKNTASWELVLRLVRKVRERDADYDKLNRDYDVLVKHYEELRLTNESLSEAQLCECGMAPTINFPEPAFRSGED